MKIEIDPLVLALISAAGGAMVSSLFMIAGQYFERQHKRKELIFKTAIKQARQRVAVVLDICKLSGKETAIPDETILAGSYYKWLEELFDKGTLPEEAIEAEKASAKELEEAAKLRKERYRIHNERVVNEAAKHPLAARQLLGQSDVSLFTPDQFEQLQQAAGQSYP